MTNYFNMIAAMSYQIAKTFAGVLMCIMGAVAIGLVVVVLLQKSARDNASSITGNTNTYYDQNRASFTDKEKILKITTIVLSCVLAVLAIVFFCIAPNN